MLTMRLKTPGRNSEWRCCFCLHVRTATILLGIWHLILHVLALSVLAVVFRNRSLIREANLDKEDDDSDPLLPTPLSNFNGDKPYYLPQNDHTLYYPDLDVSALVTVCTLAITLLLVYGAIKGKATHLLPFFCMQLFDFAVTTLTATGYLCYLRSVHRLVAENWHLPWRRELLQLSPQCLSLVVLVVFLGSMLMKAYCISIVWRCYKFLTLRHQATRSTIHYIMPSSTGSGEETIGSPGRSTCSQPDYSALLPDYEAACGYKYTPPPSYQAAMAARGIQNPPGVQQVGQNEARPAAPQGEQNEVSQGAQEAGEEQNGTGNEGAQNGPVQTSVSNGVTHTTTSVASVPSPGGVNTTAANLTTANAAVINVAAVPAVETPILTLGTLPGVAFASGSTGAASATVVVTEVRGN